MSAEGEPQAQYTNWGDWLHIEVPKSPALSKELRTFFKYPVLEKALSTLAKGWDSFSIYGPENFTTAIELARFHYPAILAISPEVAQSGTSTASSDAEKGASMAETTREWYVKTGIPLPDDEEPPF